MSKHYIKSIFWHFFAIKPIRRGMANWDIAYVVTPRVSGPNTILASFGFDMNTERGFAIYICAPKKFPR